MHRDVKPANIALCERGGEFDIVKLLDFGLVRELRTGNGDSSDQLFAGTPETMPPEATNPSAIGPRSDLYSLGCVGYHLLTGEPVFGGGDTTGVIARHRTETPPLPSTVQGGILADLEAIVMRCLAKNIDQRPLSAAAMRDQLAACADADAWKQADARRWWAKHPQLLKSETDGEGTPRSSGLTSALTIVALDPPTPD